MPPKRGGRKKATGGGRAAGGRRGKRKDSESEEGGLSAGGSDIEDGKSKSVMLNVTNYDFDRLLNDPKFNRDDLVKHIEPEELTKEYVQRSGLKEPLSFRCDPARLGMKVPDSSFSVDDVLRLVGGKRLIDVVQVDAQKDMKMSLDDFIQYYKTPAEKRKTLYNVLSLEFGDTAMEDYIRTPTFVRQIDWAELYWPDAQRQRYVRFDKKQNYTLFYTYPKVQQYCLMSVGKCYTDFHIDFGGTSVWYHVLHGRKIFWLIEPTPNNLLMYEEHLLHPDQAGFFGDVADRCQRVELLPGDTMIIPSGWIHAVFTPEDSLVFGGNFMHSYATKMQIKIYQSEARVHITKKFRFPYTNELIFYLMDSIVRNTTGRSFIKESKIEDARYLYVGKEFKEMGLHRNPPNLFTHDLKMQSFEIPPHLLLSSELKDTKIDQPATTSAIKQEPAESSFTASTGLDEELEEEDNGPQSPILNMPKLDSEQTTHRQSDVQISAPTGTANDDSVKPTTKHREYLAGDVPTEFDDDVVRVEVPPALVSEYEHLHQYILQRKSIDVPELLERPGGLVAAFRAVLARARQLHIDDGFELPEPIPDMTAQSSGVTTRKRAQNIATWDDFNLKTATRRRSKANESSQSIADDGLDSSSADEKPLRGAQGGDNSKATVVQQTSPCAKTTDVAKHMKAEDDSMLEESDCGEANEHHQMGGGVQKIDKEETTEGEATKAEVDTNEQAKTDSGSGPLLLSNLAVKKETSAEREKKRREREMEQERKKAFKRKASHHSSFADALSGVGPTSSKSSKKTKEKPLYVAGCPVTPLQDAQAAPNPYNYDPIAEIMKLGTGQLKSAYRISKSNIVLPTEKKIFKLEPKNKQPEASDVSSDVTAENGGDAAAEKGTAGGDKHPEEETAKDQTTKGGWMPLNVMTGTQTPSGASSTDMYSPTTAGQLTTPRGSELSPGGRVSRNNVSTSSGRWSMTSPDYEQSNTPRSVTSNTGRERTRSRDSDGWRDRERDSHRDRNKGISRHDSSHRDENRRHSRHEEKDRDKERGDRFDRHHRSSTSSRHEESRRRDSLDSRSSGGPSPFIDSSLSPATPSQFHSQPLTSVSRGREESNGNRSSDGGGTGSTPSRALRDNVSQRKFEGGGSSSRDPRIINGDSSVERGALMPAKTAINALGQITAELNKYNDV